jgi:hypothetical protein
MKKFTTSLFGLLLFSFYAHSQGCVAIRNLTGFGQFSIPQYEEEPIKWLMSANGRYSQFHDTFRGSDNLNLPDEDKTFSETVIVDFTLARIYENGWSIAVDLPIMSANRRNWQDHATPQDSIKTKYTTRSFGLSDVRISVYKWLFDVTQAHRGNIQIGLGLKFATGDYRYQDYFHRPQGTVVAPVNFTLQLGDGGTGITTEINAFYTLTSSISLYANGFYLFNPREQNGTSNTTGRPPTTLEKEAGADINSVPDAFSLRGGANFTVRDFVFWAGVRFEGSPVYDAFGGSEGQRRAGYIVSAEPGVNYKLKKAILFAFVPITMYGTTKQTVADKNITNITGTYRPSPGGLVDYQLYFGIVFRK